MLIPDSTLTWWCAGALAVALLSILYLKLTGWALYRRGEQGRGLMRVGGAFTVVFAVLIVFINVQNRGTYVWVYGESQGLPVGREFVLFGEAKVPARESKSVVVAEAPRRSEDQTKYVLNDTTRTLKVPLSYASGRELMLEPGLLVKTTDYFSGAQFAP